LTDENFLGFQTRLLRYQYNNSGLPFVLPLTKGIVIVPLAFFGSLWVLQYALTSNVYYDEYDGEAR